MCNDWKCQIARKRIINRNVIRWPCQQTQWQGNICSCLKLATCGNPRQIVVHVLQGRTTNRAQYLGLIVLTRSYHLSQYYTTDGATDCAISRWNVRLSKIYCIICTADCTTLRSMLLSIFCSHVQNSVLCIGKYLLELPLYFRPRCH